MIILLGLSLLVGYLETMNIAVLYPILDASLEMRLDIDDEVEILAAIGGG